jgi:hypothetical protein
MSVFHYNQTSFDQRYVIYMLFFYLVQKERRGNELKKHLYRYVYRLRTEQPAPPLPHPPLYLRTAFIWAPTRSLLFGCNG